MQLSVIALKFILFCKSNTFIKPSKASYIGIILLSLVHCKLRFSLILDRSTRAGICTLHVNDRPQAFQARNIITDNVAYRILHNSVDGHISILGHLWLDFVLRCLELNLSERL